MTDGTAFYFVWLVLGLLAFLNALRRWRKLPPKERNLKALGCVTVAATVIASFFLFVSLPDPWSYVAFLVVMVAGSTIFLLGTEYLSSGRLTLGLASKDEAKSVAKWMAAFLLLACVWNGYNDRAKIFRHVVAFIIKPSVAFDLAKAPPAPDYADPASWAALPETEDASDWLPAGFSEAENPRKDQVDVFYIHPTGFFGTTNWNAAMGERSPLGIPTEAMLGSQASAFNGVGRVYAPEYRQATLYSFLEGREAPEKHNGKDALELAYSDVARAFDYFIEHYNQGRPFILASHSQGTCHALRLVEEKIDGTDLHQRMIAAYLIGFSMPAAYFEKVYTHVKPGLSPTETDCVVTWNTIRDDVEEKGGGFHFYKGAWHDLGTGARFCVNPLTWTDDGARGPANLNRGALVADLGSLRKPRIQPDMLRTTVPRMTWAEVREGMLHVRDLSGTPFDTIMSASGNYHLFDYNLFWVNIRENALVRAQAWFKAHAAPQEVR